jgi:hypothetical protein
MKYKYVFGVALAFGLGLAPSYAQGGWTSSASTTSIYPLDPAERVNYNPGSMATCDFDADDSFQSSFGIYISTSATGGRQSSWRGSIYASGQGTISRNIYYTRPNGVYLPIPIIATIPTVGSTQGSIVSSSGIRTTGTNASFVCPAYSGPVSLLGDSLSSSLSPVRNSYNITSFAGQLPQITCFADSQDVFGNWVCTVTISAWSKSTAGVSTGAKSDSGIYLGLSKTAN